MLQNKSIQVDLTFLSLIPSLPELALDVFPIDKKLLDALLDQAM